MVTNTVTCLGAYGTFVPPIESPFPFLRKAALRYEKGGHVSLILTFLKINLLFSLYSFDLRQDNIPKGKVSPRGFSKLCFNSLFRCITVMLIFCNTYSVYAS